MEKVWFILIDGKEQGPYTIQGLKNHPLVTPDTLVRHKNSKKWLQIRYVKELEEVFKDDEPEEILQNPSDGIQGREVLAMDMRHDPANLFWILLIIIALTYVIIKLHIE